MAMQLQASVAALSLALAAFSVEASVPMTVYNQCSESIELYDNSAVEIVAAGGTTSRTLAEGFSGMFRNGVNDQATLAEFSVTGGFLWYDISIIPTGPGYCGSLEECKSVTGRTGYNTPMQIAPSGCQTVTCLNDGCADAYQYPKDDTKTHACSDSTSVVLTFCPGGSGGSTPSSYESTQQQSAPAPTTAAPTQAPTQAPTTQPPTQPPTTQPPTQPPTTQPPTQPPTEAPTTQPPTEAPTQPPTEAPTQPPTEAPTQPPTEAPTTQPPTKAPEVTYAASNSTSGDEEQAATVSPSKGTKSGLTTSTPAPAPATTAPVAQIVSAPSTSSGDSTQSANTQSSTSSGTDATTYIATGLGCCAVIAAVAVVAVARKKKQELDATEGKEYSQEDLMTPVTHINVL
ncbi:Thaumatin-like protein [Phytophthora citrophthora]|uniref:Thaumatin-like protein n=1 Tax=Phytophthora citrophthora TaxID=4793 RepID=A0AAD9G494_9STRA|nr:Thaumatin-like protein [Phytophthora citrophthora]